MFFEPSNIPTLTQQEQEKCEGLLTKDEILQALKVSPKNKSPGSDGLSPEFYLAFWDQIGPLMVDSLNYAYSIGQLSITQRQAVISLLPKSDKDPLNIQNWRPISLLNTDYKAASRCMASRISKVLSSIIHPDQTAFIKGRSIMQNIRLISDIIEYMENEKISGAILFIDFKKAFDTVEWDLMHKALSLFGFGEIFRNWVKVFYNNVQSCVINNGFSTGWFQLQRGIRQGCPLSTALFVVSIELLAITVRKTNRIKGITLPPDYEKKISGFADDTTLFVKSEVDIKASLEILSVFSKCSGLEINYNKTELMFVGSTKRIWKYSGDLPPILTDTKKPIKLLGIFIGHDKKQNEILNCWNNLKILKDKLDIWKARDLTIGGRVTLAKCFGMSKLVYTMKAISVPDSFVKEANSFLFKFLWKGKKTHIKNVSIMADLDKGGLRMTDAEEMNKALKLSYLPGLLKKDSPWTHIPNFYFHKLGGLSFLLNCNYNTKCFPIKMPTFYLKILSYFAELKTSDIRTAQDVASQIIWNNQNVKIDGKSIFYEKWLQHGIKYVSDFFDENGFPLTWHKFQEVYNLKINYLTYIGIIRSIPQTWKSLLKNEPFIRATDENTHHCLDDIKFGSGNTRDFYEIFKKRKFKTPTSEKIYSKLDYSKNVDWKSAWKLIYETTKEVKIRIFQFKVLHRILATNLFLMNNKIRDNPLCQNCNLEESVEHLFWECKECKTFWDAFQMFYNQSTQQNLELTCQTIIFGKLPSKGNELFNHLLLIAKYHLYSIRFLDKRPSFDIFLSSVKNVLLTEKNIAKQTGKLAYHNYKWQAIEAAILA